MKKLMLVLLVLALALTLIACGGSGDTETQDPGTETQDPAGNETDPGETDPPAHVHEFEDVVTKEATCAERGVKKEVCKTCGEEGMVSSIPKLAHVEGPDATCTTAKVCTVCNEELIPAFGHTFGEPIIQPATCSADGAETVVCDVCYETEVTVLPMDPNAHEILNGSEIPASCITEGSITGKCEICQQTNATIVLPMLPHTIVPGSWDMSIPGAYTTTCTACQSYNTYTAEETPVAQLDFANTDLKTEIGEDNKFFAVDDTNNKEGVYAVEGDRTVLVVDQGKNGAAWIDMYGDAFTSYDLFTISYDFKVTGDLTAGSYMSLVTFVGGYTNGSANIPEGAIHPETGAPLTESNCSWAWMGKYAADEEQFISVANKNSLNSGVEAGTIYPVDAPKDTWHTVLCIMNNKTGETSLYVDDMFVGILSNGAKPLTEEWVAAYGSNYSFRIGESKKGVLYFDNFVVSGAMLTASERPDGVHVHAYKEEIVEATCTAEGSYKKYCVSCGEVFDEHPISIAPHADELTVAENGDVSFKCSVCEREVAYKADGTLLNLTFDADIATEIAAFDKFNWVPTGYAEYVEDGDRKVLSLGSNQTFFDVDLTAFEGVDLYTISLDFKYTDPSAQADKFRALLSFISGSQNGGTAPGFTGSQGYSIFARHAVSQNKTCKENVSSAGAITKDNSVNTPLNEWHNLFVVVDQNAKNARIYVNGTLIAEQGMGDYIYSPENLEKYISYSYRFGGGGTAYNLYDNFVINKLAAK